MSAVQQNNRYLELVAELRKEKPKPWFLWDVEPGPRVMSAQPNLPWPYIKPRGIPAWRDLTRDLRTQRLNELISERSHSRSAGFETSDNSLGSMLSVAASWWTQAPRHAPVGDLTTRFQILLTPPVFRFCDLNKEFTELDDQDDSKPTIPGPFDFWIQPEVFEATGEILQGSPISEPNLLLGNSGSRPRALAAMLKQEERGSVALDMLEYVHVALDSYLARGTPDPEFVFSFSENRERQARSYERTPSMSDMTTTDLVYFYQFDRLQLTVPNGERWQDAIEELLGRNSPRTRVWLLFDDGSPPQRLL